MPRVVRALRYHLQGKRGARFEIVVDHKFSDDASLPAAAVGSLRAPDGQPSIALRHG